MIDISSLNANSSKRRRPTIMHMDAPPHSTQTFASCALNLIILTKNVKRRGPPAAAAAAAAAAGTAERRMHAATPLMMAPLTVHVKLPGAATPDRLPADANE